MHLVFIHWILFTLGVTDIQIVLHTIFVRRPIKHILDLTVTDEAGAVVRQYPLVKGITAADPYSTLGYPVNAGSCIVTHLDIELNVWINNKTTASTLITDKFNWFIWFNVSGVQTPPDPRNVTASDLKNQVFHQGMGILGCGAANASMANAKTGLYNVHLSLHIPKWAQAINKDDVIEFVYVFGDSVAVHNIALQAIFKEYEQA